MRPLIAAVLLLVGCQPQARSASYFEAHPEAAELVIKACTSGEHRGVECEHAQTGLAAQTAAARQDLFKKSFE